MMGYSIFHSLDCCYLIINSVCIHTMEINTDMSYNTDERISLLTLEIKSISSCLDQISPVVLPQDYIIITSSPKTTIANDLCRP